MSAALFKKVLLVLGMYSPIVDLVLRIDTPHPPDHKLNKTVAAEVVFC